MFILNFKLHLKIVYSELKVQYANKYAMWTNGNKFINKNQKDT